MKEMQHVKVCIQESLYTGKFVYGEVCIRESLYTGKNQDQYI